MKKKKKKIFAVIFCVVLTVASLAGVSVTVLAEDWNITVDNIEYELVAQGRNREYHVKIGRDASGDVVIPDEINGIPVTEISAKAFSKSYIKSVTMGDNIIRIQNDAFAQCLSLVSVTLGANVEVIGRGAFDSCHSMQSITINDKLTGIGELAFRYCHMLFDITMGMGLETIGENAFEGCHGLQTVILPDGVSLEGTGVGEEVRVSLNEKLKAELPEMITQRDEMQAELDTLNSRIETVREFVSTGKYSTGSVFGSGNCTVIIVCAVLVAAVIIGGIVLLRKKAAKKKN